jgi:hypothetical protein
VQSVWRKRWREKTVPLPSCEPVSQHITNLPDTVSLNSQMSLIKYSTFILGCILCFLKIFLPTSCC